MISDRALIFYMRVPCGKTILVSKSGSFVNAKVIFLKKNGRYGGINVSIAHLVFVLYWNLNRYGHIMAVSDASVFPSFSTPALTTVLTDTFLFNVTDNCFHMLQR